jgi:hypothetical protein
MKMSDQERIAAMRKMLEELAQGPMSFDASVKLGGAFLGLRDATALARYEREQQREGALA